MRILLAPTRDPDPDQEGDEERLQRRLHGNLAKPLGSAQRDILRRPLGLSMGRSEVRPLPSCSSISPEASVIAEASFKSMRLSYYRLGGLPPRLAGQLLRCLRCSGKTQGKIASSNCRLERSRL